MLTHTTAKLLRSITAVSKNQLEFTSSEVITSLTIFHPNSDGAAPFPELAMLYTILSTAPTIMKLAITLHMLRI